MMRGSAPPGGIYASTPVDSSCSQQSARLASTHAGGIQPNATSLARKRGSGSPSAHVSGRMCMLSRPATSSSRARCDAPMSRQTKISIDRLLSVGGRQQPAQRSATGQPVPPAVRHLILGAPTSRSIERVASRYRSRISRVGGRHRLEGRPTSSMQSLSRYPSPEVYSSSICTQSL